MSDTNKKESGQVVVEATIILPIAILCVILLIYVSVFVFQKAILQAALETTVVYYKNTLTDTFIEQNAEVTYTTTEDGVSGIGNSYDASEPLNPYSKFLTFDKKVSDEEFAKYFKSVEGNVLFEDDLSLSIDYSNYVLLKEIEVSAEQIVEFPIDFSIIGVDSKVNLSATAKVAVVDHDELIRNIDYAIDILEDTKVGEMAQTIANKITEVYSKMRECLGSS